jgi:uncharacterized membrane protein YciS (DUF1049 family)
MARYCLLLKEIYFKLKSLLCLAIMFGLDILVSWVLIVFSWTNVIVALMIQDEVLRGLPVAVLSK